jgi:hypothetical protein
MAAVELESPWASVDENVRACVLLHLEPCDLARVRCLSCSPLVLCAWTISFISGSCCWGGGVQVALSSRALAREAESDVVWATLFLRRFGTDFWGEDAAPHPYHVHDPFSAHIPFPFW